MLSEGGVSCTDNTSPPRADASCLGAQSPAADAHAYDMQPISGHMLPESIVTPTVAFLVRQGSSPPPGRWCCEVRRVFARLPYNRALLL